MEYLQRQRRNRRFEIGEILLGVEASPVERRWFMFEEKFLRGLKRNPTIGGKHPICTTEILRLPRHPFLRPTSCIANVYRVTQLDLNIQSSETVNIDRTKQKTTTDFDALVTIFYKVIPHFRTWFPIMIFTGGHKRLK